MTANINKTVPPRITPKSNNKFESKRILNCTNPTAITTAITARTVQRTTISQYEMRTSFPPLTPVPIEENSSLVSCGIIGTSSSHELYEPYGDLQSSYRHYPKNLEPPEKF